MQLGLQSSERNAIEDAKRVVEQLRKNGAVDTLHSLAMTALFQSEAFRSEVRQWLQQYQKPIGQREDALQEFVLSALSGLLSGTVDLQEPQQPHVSTAAGAAAAGSRGALQPQPQQQQQQQQLGGGGSLGGLRQQQQQLAGGGAGSLGGGPRQQQQQQSMAERAAAMRQRRQQQRPQVRISEEVSLKLKVALLEMLESEEKYLQQHFKQVYRTTMDHLQHHRPFKPPEFTAEPPKNVRDTPLSPQIVYEAEDDDEQQQQQGEHHQQYQQQQQQSAQGLLQQHLDASLGAHSSQRSY